MSVAGAARNGAGSGFLGAHDAERLISGLSDFNVDDVGSPKWTSQREALERLNVQAHHNAVTHSDEFVKEFLVSHDKVRVLIRELLVIEVWKEKVWKHFDDDALAAGIVAMDVYLAHHHEATLINLLEIAFFHADACEGAGDDALLELTDYCVRKLVYLVGEGRQSGSCAEADVTSTLRAMDLDCTSVLNRSARDEMEDKIRDTRFATSVCALTVLRYITDAMAELPLGVMARLLDTHDCQTLLAPLLEKQPWVRRRTLGSGKQVTEVFQDGRWNEQLRNDRMQISKPAGQCWLALTNLVCDPKCRARYRYDDSRRRSLEKLKRHFNEVLFDQLPVLLELQRSVDEVLLMVTPSAADVTTGRLILEQVPETRDSLLRRTETEWKEVARAQLTTHFADSAENRKSATKRAQDMSEVFEFMMRMEEAQKAEKQAVAKKDKPPPPNVVRVEFSRKAPPSSSDDDDVDGLSEETTSETWYRWHMVDFEVDTSVAAKEVTLTTTDGPHAFSLVADRFRLKPPQTSAVTIQTPAPLSDTAKRAVLDAKTASQTTPAPHDGKVTVTFGTTMCEALLDLPAPGRVRADVVGGGLGIGGGGIGIGGGGIGIGGGINRGSLKEETEALAQMQTLPSAMWVTVGLLARDGFAAQLKLKKTPGVHEAYRCARSGVYWVYEPAGGFMTVTRKQK